jgi:excisionase family DNA binding protein
MDTKPLLIRPEFFTVKEAAVYLNTSEKSVRRFLERGILWSSKALRKKLIPRRCLESFWERTQ